MKVVVHDASILIDLALSETVEAWFATKIETWTTELIYPREISNPGQRALYRAYAEAGQLRIHTYDGNDLENLVHSRDRLNRGLSVADISALLLAQELGAGGLLATGDRLLRKSAEKVGVKACGILGLFGLMVQGSPGCPSTLPCAVAVTKLQLLMTRPESRLPRDKCEQKIREWGARG